MIRHLASAVMALLLIAGCSGGAGKPPALGNVYSRSLSAYWAEVAAFAGIDPEDGRLHEWRLIYDEDGSVRMGRLTFLTGRGVEDVFWYTIYESPRGTEFSRFAADVAVRDVLRAAVFFAELDAVGLKELERHSGVSHPVDVKLHTIYAAGRSPVDRGHVIQGGRILTPAEASATEEGGRGVLFVTPRDYSGSLDRFLYTVPRASNP